MDLMGFIKWILQPFEGFVVLLFLAPGIVIIYAIIILWIEFSSYNHKSRSSPTVKSPKHRFTVDEELDIVEGNRTKDGIIILNDSFKHKASNKEIKESSYYNLNLKKNKRMMG